MKRTWIGLAAVIVAMLYLSAGRIERMRVAHLPSGVADGVLRVVIVGDSVAHGAGDESGRGIAGNLERALSSAGTRAATVVNLGIDGARTFTVQRLLRTARARSEVRCADAVIVSIGGNDLYGDSMARLWSTLAPPIARQHVLTRVDRVVARIHAINPSARITLLGLYDPYHRMRLGAFLDEQVNLWDARLIDHFAADRYVTVIRVADLLAQEHRLSPVDHFHPGAIGYALIAARIAPAL